MTNVLVPTDFTAASLQGAAHAALTLNRRVNIVLFHAFDLPFYYQDLIRPEFSIQQPFMSDVFRQHCKQLKEQYPNLINKITVQCMRGNSNALFRNFAEANEIDYIACPTGYVYSKIHADSLNPVPFFKKSGITILSGMGSRASQVTFSLRRNVQSQKAASS